MSLASLALVVTVFTTPLGLDLVRQDEPVVPSPSPSPAPVSGKSVRFADGADVAASRDRFGVTFLERTLLDGTIWTSQWETPRSFDGVDPLDPWFDADHGFGSFRAGGGELAISGESPRMYVHDPRLRRQWRDVEVTMYVKRVADSGVPYAGMTAVARANHLQTETGTDALCDTRGYGGRLRFDGHTDFEKETAHPENDTVGNQSRWPSGMPVGRWIGYKFLVYDRPDGVHLELWVDQTDGADGGSWKLANRVLDDGDLFGTEACAGGVDPRMALTARPHRKGSESGRPNVSVYFRSDGIATDGLLYKWGSIREIAAG